MLIGTILFLVGFALTVVGFIILIIASLWSRKAEPMKGGFGGVVLIGPLPIVFGSSRRMFRIMLIIAVLFVALILVLSVIPMLVGG